MKLEYTGPTPERAHSIDAAYDLKSAEDFTLWPGERRKVHTGLHLNLPRGFAALVMPRSGLANNSGITVLNSPGLVDPGYIGEVCVLLINHGDVPWDFSKGDRIAQIMFVKTEEIVWLHGVQTDWITERSENGFGSSGI